jgi:hypothetical protein
MSRPRPPLIEILDPQMVQVLKQLTPDQRLKAAFGMWESARLLIRGTIRQQHPDWTEDQVLRETASRLSHGATERVPRP